ncbi:hypothetical protein EON83_04295 [bacterium]|nr:MAG: hypothetical protein EON83_04295 [bacterium]
MNLEAIKSRATPIVRGTSKQNTSGKFPAGRAWSHYWAISKFPPYSGNGSMPMPQLCAYSYSDSEWNISPAYVVTVPFNAELGLYIAHYHVNQYGRDYFFEVVDGAMVPQDVHFSATELSSSEAWEHNRRFQTSGIWSDISVALARATSDSCKSPQAAQLAAE